LLLSSSATPAPGNGGVTLESYVGGYAEFTADRAYPFPLASLKSVPAELNG
jgi:hypothetical protein